MKNLALSVIMLAALPAAVFGQIPDVSGTWRLDSTRSRVAPEAGLIGLIRAGAPQTLHITQPANGTLVVESQINESHSRMYRPGGKTTTPAGPSASITMATKLDGRTLVSEGSMYPVSGAPTIVKEVFALSADGSTLTIDVTTTGPAGAASSTLVFTKIQSVGACTTWPTPCKTF